MNRRFNYNFMVTISLSNTINSSFTLFLLTSGGHYRKFIWYDSNLPACAPFLLFTNDRRDQVLITWTEGTVFVPGWLLYLIGSWALRWSGPLTPCRGVYDPLSGYSVLTDLAQLHVQSPWLSHLRILLKCL